MNYGFCTGFASQKPWAIEDVLIERIKAAGYGYVEFPLMSIAALSDTAFSQLELLLHRLNLETLVACNLFPSSISVMESRDTSAIIDEYLSNAFARAEALGIGKVVFGSAASRWLPHGLERREADRRFIDMVDLSLLPACSKFGIQVLLEPLNRGECNYLNTIKEAAEMVCHIDNSHFQLMIDLYHMNENREDFHDIETVFSLVHHVHLCEPKRRLPESAFSPYLLECLRILKQHGYDETISFESKDSCNQGGLTFALQMLKDFWKV